MDEMIDRVAQAICADSATLDWREYREEAKRAIAPMREPTRAMVIAAMITAYTTVVEAGGMLPQAREAARLEWQAMIDEALRDDT